jgi:phosphoglycerol transferase MdoB-like AlkP superfamily enzyme
LPVNNYHIPLFIYAPKHIQPSRNDTLSSQIDVAPTLLGLLNISYESQFYGNDILHMKTEDGWALISNYQRLGLYKHNKLAFLSPRQQVDVFDDPLKAHMPMAANNAEDRVLENIAYYQSANYIWTHRLSRHQ